MPSKEDLCKLPQNTQLPQEALSSEKVIEKQVEKSLKKPTNESKLNIGKFKFIHCYECCVSILNNTFTAETNERQQCIKRVEDLITDDESLDLCFSNLFFIGPSADRKIITLNRLLNVDTPFPDDADTPWGHCIQGLNVVVSSEETEWVSSSEHSQEAKHLCRYLSGHDLPFGPSTNHEAHATTKSRTKQLKEKQASKRVKSKISTQTSSQPMSQGNKLSNKQERIQSVINRLQKLVKSKHHYDLLLLLGRTLFSINIIGDHPSFLEMLPALSTGPAMHFIFSDICKEYNKIPGDIHSEKDASIASTIEVPLSQILGTVQHTSYESSLIDWNKVVGISEKLRTLQMIPPVAAVAGTHKDQLSVKHEQLGRSLNEALKTIASQYKDYPASNLSYFSIGTDESNVQSIRDFISKISHTQFRDASLPIHPEWLWLVLILRREYKIVSKQDCFKIAKSFEMSSEEVEFSLCYLHSCTGMLLYYPDIPDSWFKNHIICSPQVVFDSIHKLIIKSLNAHSTRNGQFSIESVEEYAKSDKKLKKEELIPIQQLVKLLQHLNLLSQITHTKVDGGKRTTYFIPALLVSASPVELTASPQPEDSHPEPLCITFTCGYIPTGLFCGLINRLVSIGLKGILGLRWELVEEDIKQNCISFCVANASQVTLISHKNCYEVRVTHRDSKISKHDLCSYILSAILYTLKSVYNQLTPQVAFQYPRLDHKSTIGIKHLCILTDGSQIQFLCNSKSIVLTKRQQIWFGKVSQCNCSFVIKYSRASIIRTSFIRNLDYLNLNLHLLMRFMNNFNEIHGISMSVN